MRWTMFTPIHFLTLRLYMEKYFEHMYFILWGLMRLRENIYSIQEIKILFSNLFLNVSRYMNIVFGGISVYDKKFMHLK